MTEIEAPQSTAYESISSPLTSLVDSADKLKQDDVIESKALTPVQEDDGELFKKCDGVAHLTDVTYDDVEHKNGDVTMSNGTAVTCSSNMEDTENNNTTCSDIIQQEEKENSSEKKPGNNKQRKGSIRRNMSIGNLKRIFKKQHSRHFSESPVTTRREDSPTNNATTSSKSEGDCHEPFSPTSPGLDDVFDVQYPQKPKERAQSVIDSGAKLPIKSYAATLPRAFSDPSNHHQQDADGMKDDKSTMAAAAMLWKKLGSFNFNPSSHDDECQEEGATSSETLDKTYQVLKESVALRDGSVDESLLTVSPTSVEATPNSKEKRTLKHQLSEPTPPCSSPFQEVRRAVSNTDSLERTGLSPSEIPLASSESRLNVTKKSRTPPPLQSVNEENSSTGKTESSGYTQSHKQKQLERSVDAGSTYVSLYDFDEQQQGDLSIRAGNLVRVTNDKHAEWWKGELGQKSGYFPAKFVMKMEVGEDIYSCLRSTTMKCFDEKEIQLRKNQIVAVKTTVPSVDNEYLFGRCLAGEGNVRKEDLKPL